MSWNDLANSPRWRGIASFIRGWVGPFDASHGMDADELDRVLQAKGLRLPAAVREWCLLAARWEQGGLNVWVRPEALAEREGMVEVLTDAEGINQWSIRAADARIEDPPVFNLAVEPGEIQFASFSQAVAAMIVNDVLFTGEEPVELDPHKVRSDLTCLVSSPCGDFYSDAPLESATVVAFTYPQGGPAFGKSRTPGGRRMMEGLRPAA